MDKGKVVVAQETDVMGPIVVEEPISSMPVIPMIGEGPKGELLLQPSLDGKEWSTPKEFLVYLRGCFDRVPQFQRTNGPSMERAISYYNRVLRDISNVLRDDAEDADLSLQELSEVQDIRNRINKQIEMLEKAKVGLSKTLRKSEVEEKMVKEATTPVITTIKTPFIFDLSRDIVNARVSSGRNMEDLYIRAVKEFKLNKREKVELAWALKDMGWPIHQPIVFDFAPENYQG